MAIVNDPQSESAELVRIVEQDPALAMQSLHLCNSAYYSLPVEVTSVTHAVRFLGMDTVAGLAMAAYFQALMPSRGPHNESPWLSGLKDHLLVTAQWAEALAQAAGSIVAPATLFTAGLLHDTGKLVLSTLDSIIGREVYHHMETNDVTLIEAEQELLDTDHAEIGCHLAIRWQLPDVLADAIKYHHDPFASEYDQTLYVFLANTIANSARDKHTSDLLSVDTDFRRASEELGFSVTQIIGMADRQHPEDEPGT